MQDFVVDFFITLIGLLIIGEFTCRGLCKVKSLNGCYLFIRWGLPIVKLSIYSFVLLFKDSLDDRIFWAHIVSHLVNEDERKILDAFRLQT